MSIYARRVIDTELDELITGLAAISLCGPKGVGKTATAARRAATTIRLDDPSQAEPLLADPSALANLPAPVLLDEWQRAPYVWDMVRRAVDDDRQPGHFLLTGSATPTSAPTHSGAGRIVDLRMRPMSLFERGVSSAAVSLGSLLSGTAADKLSGHTAVTVTDYAEQIIRSGFPGMRNLPTRAIALALDGYVSRIVEHDFTEQGRQVRRPTTLRTWMRAYAAASSTTASYNAILDAATPGEEEKPAKTTTIAYRDVLSQLWLLDPVPGWLPVHNDFARLAVAPKHQLADPALAARLLDLDAKSLSPGGRHVANLGKLFESLATLDIRVYAQAAQATVNHLRTRNGDHEVDLILQASGGGICALEVKLSASITDADVRHLHWLRGHLGEDLVEAAIITAGPFAYRRKDGIGVIPLALLGP